MVLPEVLLKWASDHRQAVLVVVPTQYAAQMMVESFVNFRKWKRYQLQLRTGADKDDVFHREYTQLSIVTYGMLWRWLTCEAGGYKWLLRRYKGFLLDEFARIPPSEMDDGVLQPQVEECASILSKLVEWSDNTARLLVTSAALRKEHVQQCFGKAAGFLAITAKRFSLQRIAAAP